MKGQQSGSRRRYVQHVRSASGIPVCAARKPRGGWLFVERYDDSDCKACRKILAALTAPGTSAPPGR